MNSLIFFNIYRERPFCSPMTILCIKVRIVSAFDSIIQFFIYNNQTTITTTITTTTKQHRGTTTQTTALNTSSTATMSSERNKTLLDRLPAEILQKCLAFATPDYEYVMEDGSCADMNPHSRVLARISRADGVLSEFVQRVALETSFSYLVIQYTSDINRLDRLFRRDQSLGRTVRRIFFSTDILGTRPLSLPPYVLPCSPPESASGGDSRSPSPFPSNTPISSNSSDVDMLDIDNVSVGSYANSVAMADRDPMTRDVLDQAGLAVTPLFRLLLRCFDSIHARQQDLQTRDIDEADEADESRQLHAETANRWATSVILATRLLLQTTGVVDLAAYLHGLLTVPAIECWSDGLVLPQLRTISAGEHDDDIGGNDGKSRALCTLDIGSLLLRSAPNLEELMVSALRYVIEPPSASNETSPLTTVDRVVGTDYTTATTTLSVAATTTAFFPKLRYLTLDDMRLSQCSLDRLLSIIGPELEYVEITASNLGTVGRNQRRKKPVENDDDDLLPLDDGGLDDCPFRNGYKELTATCHGVLNALLPWRHSLRKLDFQALHLDAAYHDHLNHLGFDLYLGTKLLPRFERLEELTISLHLFHASHFFCLRSGLVDAGGMPFESFATAHARVCASLVGHLPPNLRRLVLLPPDPIDKLFANATAAGGDGLLRMLQKLSDSTHHKRPISGLIRTMLTTGEYPHLRHIRVEKAQNVESTYDRGRELQNALFQVPGTQGYVCLTCTQATRILARVQRSLANSQ